MAIPRKRLGALVALGLSAAMAGCASSGTPSSSASGGAATGASQPSVTIKLADDFPASDPFNTYLQKFANEVQTKTNSSVTFKLFDGNELGGEADIVRQTANNSVQMDMVGVTGYAPLDAFFTPYAVASEHQLQLVMQKNLLQKYFDNFQKSQNEKLVGALYVSPREMTSDKPVKTVQDLQGIKIRVPQIQAEVQVFKALGADPTVLAFPEVYTALQNGTAQAQENPVSTILSAKFYDVQKYLDMTNHGIQPEYLFINTQTWSKLSAQQKSAINSAFADIQKQQRAAGEAAFAKDVKTLQSDGMTVVQPDNAAFRQKVYDSTVKPILVKLWGTKIAQEVSQLPTS